MRGICARVLAAALLAATVAAVVGLVALYGGPTSDAGTPVTAPPSSVERTVRLTAQPASKHRSAPRLVATHTTAHTAVPQREVLGRSVVFVRKQPAKRLVPTRHLAAAAADMRTVGTNRMARVPRLTRKIGPLGVALTAWDIWHRLSPNQRKQVMNIARKHGPAVAARVPGGAPRSLGPAARARAAPRR